MRRSLLRWVAPPAVAATAVATVLLAPTAATAAPTADSEAFRASVTLDGIREHLEALQDVADLNDGNRASGTSGYEDSGDYVESVLEAADYETERQYFTFDYFSVLAPTTFERVSPEPATYVEGEQFAIMSYSGSGAVTATVQAVDVIVPIGDAPANTSTSGCEDADFTAAGFEAGSIALVQRGTCTFAEKAVNAQEAGAAGVIIFNEGQAADDRDSLLFGTLGAPVDIPVIGTDYVTGAELASLEEPIVSLAASTFFEVRETFNVIAQTPTGRTDRVVLVGAHLDSVEEGAGINDNGSGTATILEIAEQLEGVDTENAVRFAFWGAEESGLLGAEHYVAELSKRDRKDIALNLNFDMLGSANYVPFVYDGDGSADGASGPNGSGTIESVFADYLAARGGSEPTAFDGRSDYGPFIAAGIPAGGLFSGAEGIKTDAEAELYGGTAGEPYDPCYHAACDDITNISDEGLELLADAAAHATYVFAQTESAVNGTGKASTEATAKGDHAGHKLLR